MDPDVLKVFSMLLSIVLTGGLGFAIVMTVLAHYRRKVGPGAVVDSPEVEELRQRIASIEANQDRVAELEERLDFAERLLSQRNDPARIEGRNLE